MLAFACSYHKTSCDACRSQQQQKVLNTSDAALVEQCKAILSAGAAASRAVQTEQHTSPDEPDRQDTSPHTQPQVVYDVMDAETQLLGVPPDATLVYKAVNQPEVAHCPANHNQPHKGMGSTLPAATVPPDVLADRCDSQIQPVLASPNNSSELPASAYAEPAGGSQLTGAAAQETVEKQPSASVSAATVPPYSVPAAKTASNHGGSGMNALLQAMLTGELTS